MYLGRRTTIRVQARILVQARPVEIVKRKRERARRALDLWRRGWAVAVPIGHPIWPRARPDARSQQANGQVLRDELADSAWTELDLAHTADSTLSGLLSQNLAQYYQRYNAELGLSLPISSPRRTDRWIVKRYRPDDGQRPLEQFQTHFDSVGPASNRYLVFLWYLNTVAEGGETRFVDLSVDIAPQEGRLLVFPPYWMFQHAGLPPRSQDKFILSTYLTY